MSAVLSPVGSAVAEYVPSRQWLRMVNAEDLSPVVRTMLRERVVKSEKRALEVVHAFLQWMSLSTLQHEKPFLMFNGAVDKAFHCFVLNTEYYAAFCQRNFGKFINHNPLDGDAALKVLSEGGVEFTLDLMDQHFGDSLSPELKRWRKLHLKGKLTARSVSCVGCCH
jgi:hypothetical protein